MFVSIYNMLKHIVSSYIIKMKIFGEIQRKLGKTDPEMARLLGLRDSTAWISFKKSVTRISTRPFLACLDESPLPLETIIESMKSEINKRSKDSRIVRR